MTVEQLANYLRQCAQLAEDLGNQTCVVGIAHAREAADQVERLSRKICEGCDGTGGPSKNCAACHGSGFFHGWSAERTTGD